MDIYLRDMQKGAESAVRGMTSSRLKRQQDEEQRMVAQAELDRSRALKAGGKENPDGSITPKRPSFWDYLNPVGEYGLFGKRNTARVAQNAERAGDAVRGGIDNLLGEEGDDKFNSPKDVARFGLNLIPGMIEGIATSGRNLEEMKSGQRLELDESGRWTGATEGLSLAQRAGAGAVGVLDTVGLGLGGTGKFFSSILKGGIKDITKTAIGMEVGKTIGRVTVEGAEEAIGSVAADIQDDDQLDDEWKQNALKSFGLGVAAGGVFDIAGRGISGVKNARARAKDTSEGTAVVDEVVNEEVVTETTPVDPEVAKRNEKLVRQDSEMNDRLIGLQDQITALQNGTDPSVRKLIADDGTDVTAVGQKYANDIRKLETQIRDLQAQSEGKYTAETRDAPEEAFETKGMDKPTLNVGMNIGDKTALSPEQITKLLKDEFDVDVVSSTVKESGTEPTFIPELSRALTPEELYRLSELTEQDAIAHHTGTEGLLQGPKAKDWGGKFNSEYFMDQEGTSYKDLEPDISEYSGDIDQVAARYETDVNTMAKAAAQIPKIREQLEALKKEQSEQFEMLGGVRDMIDKAAVKAKLRELKAEKANILDWKVRNNVGATAQSLQRMIDDLDNGVVNPDFVQVRERVDTAVEALNRAREFDPADVSQIQRAAIINEIHREAANNKLADLWTEDRHEQHIANLRKEYKTGEAEIKELPKPEQEAQMAMLDENYIAETQDAETRLQEDRDEVIAAQQALKIADDIDGNIVDRYNSLQESDPVAFGKVDSEAMGEIRTSLDIALTLKKAEEAPETVTPVETEGAITQSVRHAATQEEATAIIESDEGLSNQASVLLADQVSAGTLKGGLGDYFASTARDALNKLENGDKITSVLDGALNEAGKSDARMKELSKQDRWKASWKDDASRDQSIAFWDNGEPLTRMKGESESAFNQRVKSTESVKSWLESKAEEQGMSSEQMITNYFPHNFQRTYGKDFETVAEAIERLRTNTNAKGNKLTAKQRQMLSRKLDGVDLATRQRIEQAKIYKVGKNGHLEKRHGAEGWSRDIPFVLESYQRMSNKSTYIQPALDTVRGLTVDLEGAQLAFVEDAINTVTGGRSRVDQVLGEKMVKTTSNLRRTQNIALMGFSVRTVALQPVATLNNLRKSPDGMQYIASTLRAMKATFDPKSALSGQTNPLLREFREAGGMVGAFSTTIQPTVTNKIEDAAFFGIQKVDENMRLAAYDIGKQSYIKSLGKKAEDLTPQELDSAKQAGVKMASEAQFGTGPMDIPLAQNNEVGKIIFQIQQFNMKQFGQEFKYLYGDDVNSFYNTKEGRFTKKGATNLVKTLAGYAAIYALYTQIAAGDDENSKNPFGFGMEDMLPFGEILGWLVDGVNPTKESGDIQMPIPPLISATFGRGGQDKGIIGHLYQGLTGGEEVDTDDQFNRALRSAIRNFVPGGTQMMRSYDGAEAVAAGESKSTSGSTRFLIDNSNGWNVMKGLISGQYATTEGQQWLENGMNTISKTNTIELPNGDKVPASEYIRNEIKDPEKKAAWIGYYATKQNAEKELKKQGLNRTELLRDVRLRLTAGEINQAQADIEIERYNGMVRELYRPYRETIKEWEPRLSTDFLENMLILPNKATPIRMQSMTEEKVNTLNSWYEEETL